MPGLSRCGYERLVAPRNCEIEGCRQQALPCTRYCTLHIMHNADQVLFDYCTAKFADNTQCSVPVFDITHELPLCPEHARKRVSFLKKIVIFYFVVFNIMFLTFLDLYFI